MIDIKSAQYLHHVTLNTGHSRKSYRSEVGGIVIEQLAHELLPAALAGYAHLPVEAPACLVHASATEHALIATVWVAGEDGREHGVPICTVGVAATRSRDFWALLHNQVGVPLVTDPEKPPPAPWCAARLEAGALLHPAALHWLGDFERCLAWAWLEANS